MISSKVAASFPADKWLSEMEGAGFLRTSGTGARYVVGQSTHPLTGAVSAYVAWMEREEELQATVALVQQEFEMPLLVRVSRAPKLWGGCQIQSSWIVKDLDLNAVSSTVPKVKLDPLGSVRRSTFDDEMFVKKLLVSALVDGDNGHLRDKTDDVEKYVETVYGRSIAHNGLLCSFILELDGVLAGHALAVKHSYDEITGRVFYEIVDTYILEEYRGMGLSPILEHAIELDAAKLGNSMLGHVTGNSPERVLERLICEGWTLSHQIVRVDVGPKRAI